jgi:discoidin domain receptor family protein 2
MGRARQDTKGGAWCPAHTISSGVREWIEINLHADYRITATETMGRFGGGQGQEFAETYQIEYWRESTGVWHLYTNTTGHDVLKGNTNTYMAHKQQLHPPIVASRVRFLPFSEHPRTICMRVEVYGCADESPVISYQAPQGEEFSPHIFLEDIYDGQKVGSLLTGGLGQLADGHIGTELSFSKHGISEVSVNGWVGWTNKKSPLELTFVFKSFHSVRAVNIVAYNKQDMGIQAPSSVGVSVKGVGEEYSDQEDVVADTWADNSLEGPTIISYSVNYSLATEVKLFLHFSSKWIILSEVFFTTEAVKQPLVEKIEKIDRVIETQKSSDVQSENIRQDMPFDDSKMVEEDSTNHLERKPILHRQNSDFKQTYIGIGIGILSMAVIMLMVIIYLILRKNRHQIFSKHSIFKSPLTNKGSDLTMVDARLRLSPLIYNMNPSHRTYGHDEDSETEEASIYHEPCRLPFARQEPKNIIKNKSCGTLCEYENFHKQDLRFSNNFGSTPLFNLPTVDPPARVPPISHSFTTNFKDSYPYGYSTPVQPETQKTLSDSEVSENFYAASDIFHLKQASSNSNNWGTYIPPHFSRSDINHY